MTKPTLIALTGATGAGKDTLAELLSKQFGYTRISFGDELRKLVVEQYGPLLGDERIESYCELGSFKDAMVKVGGVLAMSQPLLLSELVQVQLIDLVAKHLSVPVVVTDMRKPVEMLMLAGLSRQYNVYFVRVLRTHNPHKPKPLDDLLGSGSSALSKYYTEGITNPSLPPMHGVVRNCSVDTQLMVNQVQRILELSVPYNA